MAAAPPNTRFFGRVVLPTVHSTVAHSKSTLVLTGCALPNPLAEGVVVTPQIRVGGEVAPWFALCTLTADRPSQPLNVRVGAADGPVALTSDSTDPATAVHFTGFVEACGDDVVPTSGASASTTATTVAQTPASKKRAAPAGACQGLLAWEVCVAGSGGE